MLLVAPNRSWSLILSTAASVVGVVPDHVLGVRRDFPKWIRGGLDTSYKVHGNIKYKAEEIGEDSKNAKTQRNRKDPKTKGEKQQQNLWPTLRSFPRERSIRGGRLMLVCLFFRH